MTILSGSVVRNNLHDSVALGNFEEGLILPTEDDAAEETSKQQTNTQEGHPRDDEEEKHQGVEVERLPLLLRILSKSRPLATNTKLPVLKPPKEDEDATDTDEELKNEKEKEKTALPQEDDVLEQAVRRLEDRAAVYSQSESIEVVSVHLAPHVCRKIAKLPSCRRRRKHGPSIWDTKDLVAVAQNPASSRFQQQSSGNSKRRKVSVASGSGNTHQDQKKEGGASGDEFASDSDENMAEDEEEGASKTKKRTISPKRKRVSSTGGDKRRDSVLLAAGAAEDSQEAFVTKTLSELALLVAQYLQQQNRRIMVESSSSAAAVIVNKTDGNEEGTGGGGKGDNENSTATDAIMVSSVEESILAQARVVDFVSSSKNRNSSTLLGTDLGATVASILYYAPVLKHSHVAAALCEAGQPQAPHLIQRMAANCPATVPSLVRGCCNALVNVSTHSSHSNAESAAETKQHQQAHDSLLALSQLSRRERQRIRSTLRGLGVANTTLQLPWVLRLQLQCALDHGDPVDLACFLLEHMPRNPFDLPWKVAGEEDVPMEEGDNPRKEPDKSDSEAFPTQSPKHVASLATEIHSDAKAATTTPWITRIYSCLASGWKGMDRKVLPRGKLCLLLRSYLWVLLTKTRSHSPKALTASALQIPQLLVLVEWFLADKQEQNNDKASERESSSKDTVYCMLVSALLFCTMFLEGTEEETAKITKATNELWSGVPSQNSKVFLGRVSCVLQSDEDQPLLRCLLLECLCATKDAGVVMACRRYDHFHDGETQVRKLWRDHLNLLSALETSLSAPTVCVDLKAALETLQWKPELLVNNNNEKLQSIVQLLVLKKPHHSKNLLTTESTFQFLVKSASLPLNSLGGSTSLPVVQSLHLEMQASIVSRKPLISVMDDDTADYLLKLVYCFAFRDAQPDSPFSIDPRSIPLKSVFLLMDEDHEDEISESAKTFLLRQIEEHAPTATKLARYHKRLLSLGHVFLADKACQQTKEEVIRAMRLNMQSKAGKDPPGSKMERLVLQSFITLSEQDFVAAVACSLLSEQSRSPPLFLTYSKLCEDPLVILKIPLKHFWSRPGFRRSVLFLLRVLLNVNSAMLDAVCTDESTKEELTAVRDVLSVRCLISACFLQDNSTLNCFSTVSLVRGIIAKHTGLGALLFTQGFSIEEMDWLIDAVPELFADAPLFRTELFAEDKVSMAPAERLMVADGVMRTAVLYGQRDESTTEALALASLSQLIAGFFLVLGPSGVAVSMLLSDGSSTVDTTQLSRRSALRILKHVAAVRGYRKQLRNECVVGLLKLLRMCKGEEIVGGLSVAVGGGGRQKAILREIQDAISRAMSSMGAVSG